MQSVPRILRNSVFNTNVLHVIMMSIFSYMYISHPNWSKEVAYAKWCFNWYYKFKFITTTGVQVQIFMSIVFQKHVSTDNILFSRTRNFHQQQQQQQQQLHLNPYWQLNMECYIKSEIKFITILFRWYWLCLNILNSKITTLRCLSIYQIQLSIRCSRIVLTRT